KEALLAAAVASAAFTFRSSLRSRRKLYSATMTMFATACPARIAVTKSGSATSPLSRLRYLRLGELDRPLPEVFALTGPPLHATRSESGDWAFTQLAARAYRGCVNRTARASQDRYAQEHLNPSVPFSVIGFGT